MNDASDREADGSLPATLAAAVRSVQDFPQTGLGLVRSSGFRRSFYVKALKVADLVGMTLAGFAAYFIRFGTSDQVSPSAQLFVYLSTIVTVVSLHLAGSYQQQPLQSMTNQFSKMFTGCIGALLLILFCGFMSGELKAYSRIWIGSTFMMGGLVLLINRIVLINLCQKAIANKQLMETIIIVGANKCAERIVETILQHGASGINIVGIFDDRDNRPLPQSLIRRYLGTTDALLSAIRINRVDRVVVALSWVASGRIEELLKKLRTVPVRIDLVPNDLIWQFSSIGMERVGGVPVVTIANGRIDEQNGLIKRIEDIVISASLLLLASPLLLLIAALIKLDSKGPVLFQQKRHGFNNEIFNVYKFRTMTPSDASSGRVVQATVDDHRVTRLGYYLRRSSLDELPQLFNVLRGEMSVVGPRPHAVQHNMDYAYMISEYLARHNVKPGITGWAQVNGLRGETDTAEKMRRRVDFDLYYIEQWSLLLDLKIILMTALTVWFQQTAY